MTAGIEAACQNKACRILGTGYRDNLLEDRTHMALLGCIRCRNHGHFSAILHGKITKHDIDGRE
jgi:hypothetical protein